MNNWDTLESTKPTMARTPPDTNVYRVGDAAKVLCAALAPEASEPGARMLRWGRRLNWRALSAAIDSRG